MTTVRVTNWALARPVPPKAGDVAVRAGNVEVIEQQGKERDRERQRESVQCFDRR